MEAILIRFLIAAAATTLALATSAAAQPQDFCLNYANSIVATNYRGMQRQCPQFRNANMDWEAHFNWCGSQPVGRVKQADEQNSSKLDGCMTAAVAPPPRAPAPPPTAARAAPGQSFYTKQEGGLCVDITGGQIREGTPIMLWTCHSQAPQRFGTRGGQVFVAANPDLCVDGGDRQQLVLVDCRRSRTQWRYDARSGQVRSNGGLCWDINNAVYEPRAQVIAYQCHNGANQRFVLNN